TGAFLVDDGGLFLDERVRIERRWSLGARGGKAGERGRGERDARQLDSGELGDGGSGHGDGLLRAGHLGAGGGEFGFGAGLVGAGAELGIHQGGDGANNDVGAIRGGLRGLHGFLRGDHGEVCVGGGGGDFELGALTNSFGLALRGGGGFYVGFTESEIEGLPG